MRRALTWLGLLGLLIAGVGVCWVWLRHFSASAPETAAPVAAPAPADSAKALATADPFVSPESDAGGGPIVADEPLPIPDAERADPRSEVDHAFMRSALEGALAEHLASVKLTPEQMEELAAALLALRNSREALRTLPMDAEHAEQRRTLLEVSAQANETFRRIVEMTPDEFTAVVQPEVGIDEFSPEDPIPDPEFIEEPE